jgi:hypothetical protein
MLPVVAGLGFGTLLTLAKLFFPGTYERGGGEALVIEGDPLSEFARLIFLVAVLLPSCWALWSITTRYARQKRGSCPNCGYDLRGALEKGCPECGWNRSEPS